MVRNIFKILVVSFIAVILLNVQVFASATGKVTGNHVRIREKASSKSIEVSVAMKDEKVEILGEEGDWYYIKFEKVTGYISKEFVDTDYKSDSNTSNETDKNDEITENNDKEEENKEPEKQENIIEENETVENPADEQENQENENTTDNSENISTVNLNDIPKKYEINQTVTIDKDAQLKYMPNFSSRVCCSATSGSTYTVKACLNNWIKIANETNSGWILIYDVQGESVETEDSSSNNENQDNQNETNTQETSNVKGIINVDSARLRKAPNGDVLDSIKKGTEVTILNEEGDWYNIKTIDYDSCYIAKRLVTKK